MILLIRPRYYAPAKAGSDVAEAYSGILTFKCASATPEKLVGGSVQCNKRSRSDQSETDIFLI